MLLSKAITRFEGGVTAVVLLEKWPLWGRIKFCEIQVKRRMSLWMAFYSLNLQRGKRSDCNSKKNLATSILGCKS